MIEDKLKAWREDAIKAQAEVSKTYGGPFDETEYAFGRILKLIDIIEAQSEALGRIHHNVNTTEMPDLRGNSIECTLLASISHDVEASFEKTKEILGD